MIKKIVLCGCLMFTGCAKITNHSERIVFNPETQEPIVLVTDTKYVRWGKQEIDGLKIEIDGDKKNLGLNKSKGDSGNLTEAMKNVSETLKALAKEAL